MSATDPSEEGGRGGEPATGGSTNTEENVTPTTPATGTSVPAGSQQQHPPPSPLSGCYLLVVLPEPHTAQHKDLILNRLAKGFLSWDKDSCHVDLEKELQALVAQAPEGEEARNGERLIQYATENLVTEVLIHPQTNTLLQCIRNLLASFTKHRHIIHAGYTFGGNGSWILQDGTFSLADFLDAFSEHEVQRVLRAYENSVTVDIHCAGVGDWTTSRLSKEPCTRSCRVRVNPDDVLTAGVPAITSFTNYVGQYLVAQTLDQLMEPSDVVGNIRFSHPTLYVFPGGQGDAALFGINGFNMLVDGGFARKACFWDFTRHLDRLDAVLVTRINNSNVGGMSSVLRKKKEMHVYPQIGHFFCNLVERRQSNSPDGDKDIDPLILNLTDIGQEMMANLRHINLRPHPCYRDPDPINLYHKVGHGTLDMYVLSPSKDSREVREFMAKWHAADSKLFAGFHKKDPNILTFPIQNLTSICALLVWQPANPEDTITRILFPGSTPQHKIFEGFERLKHLDFLKHPVCSAKSLSPSTSLAALRDKPVKQKLGIIEKETKKEVKKEKKELSESKVSKPSEDVKPQPTPIIPTGKPQGIKAEMKAKKVVENKKIESDGKESKKIEKELKEVKKEQKKETPKVEKPEKPDKPEKKDDESKKPEIIKSESEKPEKPAREAKPKPEIRKRETKETKAPTKASKVELTPKPKPIEKKKPSAEKKDTIKSSPTTPKKTLNGAATKTEISKAPQKAKPIGRPSAAPPGKSAKDANNRKVVEQKNIEMSTIKDTAKETPSAGPAAKAPAKPKAIDRKPISRRTKPVSPSKARVPLSPAKSTRSTPTASVKSDKDGVVRKIKGERGTTDSSTVSTPSGIEHETVAKLAESSLAEKSEDISLDSIESKVLADLKEEREVVEEIEAVLQKAERIEEARKEDHFEGDDEITAEATDKKDDDMTEEDVTAEIEDAPKKESSRKESQELTEEDEYLIVEKEEVYTEDSVQSGEGEQKHVLDEAESEKAKILEDIESVKERQEKEEPEEKGKVESPEKEEQEEVEEVVSKDEKEKVDKSPELKDQLDGEAKEVISSPETVQKTEDKDDSGKKDSEDITKEPSSLSPDKFDSSEKKTTDTDMKPDTDLKDQVPEKLEESQERISTLESGATTTAPTLPEDERIPLDEIKEDIDEKHVMEEVKEKDVPKVKEEILPRQVPVATAKPEVKAFDVRQAPQGIQREIVKTPDEVADLPVHEEVDPKFYRMEDFEKDKEEKPVTPQETKEPPTPTVKEQKGVLGFFGKVADKFEKGIDKLTKKSKKDTADKDADDKSSSKSSSPKEPKPQEKILPVAEVDMEKLFPKVGKPEEKAADVFEKIEPTMVDVKVASIKETAAFIKEEIEDARGSSVPETKVKITDKVEEIAAKEDVTTEKTPSKDSAPISPVTIETKKEPIDDILRDEGEDAEEIKALLEEASKKFKTVKDSLRDSIESLEEIIEEELPERLRQPSLGKDIVKDTLEGVVERLEEMKPQMESMSSEPKETDKVKFDIPKDEEFEKDYESIPGPMRDVKEAVRDVGEVLAGTAGIEIDDKPKDVVEIVKKVAEVLKEDDFLPEKLLFEGPLQKKAAEPTERKPSVAEAKADQPEEVADKKDILEDVPMPKKVGVTEVLPSEEEIEEALPCPKKPKPCFWEPDSGKVHEEPCVKVVKEVDVISPVKDDGKDKEEAKKICEEIMEEDHVHRVRRSIPMEDDSKVDVMDSGEEIECVKEVCKPRPKEEKELEKEIEEPEIAFDKKVAPAKAELVIVTPGSTPSSPKFAVDKIYDIQLQETIKSSKLPADVKNVLNKDAPPKEIIEELIVVKKTKITVEIIEYITIVKRISREQVIYIIQEIIVKKGIPKESVVDDVEILNLEKPITPEKRVEIEDYIFNEYISKGKKITIEVIEEISIIKMVPRRIVIEIVEEIIVKKKLVRNMIVDFSAEQLSELDQAAPTVVVKEEITAKADIIEEKRKSIVEVSSPLKEKVPSPAEKEPEMAPQESTTAEPEEKVEDDGEEEKIVDGFVSIPSSAALISHDRKPSHEKIEAAKISPVQSEKDVPLPSKEHDKDAIDDFEAVEQEYKVKGVRVTSPEDVSPEPKKEDDFKDVAEEAEDDVSDVIEADEKFVKETKEKVGKPEPDVLAVKEEKLIEKKDEKITEKVEDKKEEKKEHEDVTAEDVSEVSEIIDAKEKYLDEAKEKTEDAKEIAQAVTKEPVSDVIDKRKESLREAVSPAEAIPSLEEKKEAPSRKESAKEIVIEEKPKPETDKLEKDGEKSPQFQDEPEEKTITPEAAAETKLADATGRAAEPKLDVRDEDKEKSEPKVVDTKELEDQKKEEEPPKGDVTIAEQKPKPKQKPKQSKEEVKTEIETEAAKEDLKTPEIPAKIDEKLVAEEKPVKDEDVKISEKPSDLDKEDAQETGGTVQKMLVTASSEDGGQETVICPTGTITFSKTVTPDDSLKDTSIKSTSDKDSLHLDKDSLRSDVSTPEKDSISEKSLPEAKDTGKITPEDSLDKSPLGKRDSPDLEDSLEKTDTKKPKEVDSGSPSIEVDVPQSPVDEKPEKVEVSEKSTEVIKKETESAAEKIETAEVKSDEQPQLAKVSEDTAKKPISPVEKEIAKEITEDLKSPGDKKTTEAAAEIPKSPVDKKAVEETVDVPKSPIDKKTPETAVEVPKLPVDKKTTEEVVDKSKSPVSTEVTQEVPEKAKTPEERGISGTGIEKPTSLDDKKELEVSEKPKSPVEKTVTDEKPKSPVGKELAKEVKEETVSLKSPVDKKPLEEVPDVSKAAVDEKLSDAVAEKPKSPEDQKVSKTAADKETTKKAVEKPADKQIPEEVPDKAKSPVIPEVPKELPIDKNTIDEISAKPKTAEISAERLDAKSFHSEAQPSETIPSEDVSPAETIFEKSPTDKPDLSLSQISSEQKKQEVDVEATLTEKVSSPLEKEKTPSPPHEGAPLEKAEIKKEPSPSKEIKVPELSDKEKTPSPVDKPTDGTTVSKSRSPSISGEKAQEIGLETLKDRSRSASIVSDKGDIKDLKSPIGTDKELDEKEVLEPLTKVPGDVRTEETEVEHPADKPADRSRAASVVSEKQEEKPTDKPEDKDLVRSRSSSVAGDKVDHVEEPTSKSRAASIVSTTDEQKKLSDLEEILSKSRSSSIVSEKHDEKEPVDDKVNKKPEVVDLPEKPKSLDIVSDGIPEESKQIDKSRSPSLAGDKAEIKETDTQKSPTLTEKEEKVSSTTTEHSKEVESAEIKSSSVVSDKSPGIVSEELIDEKHEKETEKRKSLVEESAEQKSRSPSIISEHHEEKGVTDAKSPSAVSDKSDEKQVVAGSKSPSIASEQLDLKDVEHLSQESKSPSVAEAMDEKTKSPSITGDEAKKDELQEMAAVSSEKSPVIEGDKASAKTPSDVGDKVTDETKEVIDKSRSASIVSIIDEKESIDASKPMEDKSEKQTSESKSPISDKADEKKEDDRSKSPSTVRDKPEIAELTEQPMDKSRSASIVSTTDQKEPSDHSKSPSAAGEKLDLKDVLEPGDKSRSASIVSTTDHKESADHSKSPSIAGDKLDLKDVLEATDQPKSPGIAEDKSEVKDALEPTDKSRSPSIASASDHKEPDRSKSPSVAGDKPDHKDVLEPADKSRSASIASIADQKEPEHSKSPSIASEKPDLKDVLEPTDKSRSASIASVADQKEPDHSKSPSVASEKPDLKDVLEPTDKSRSASTASVADHKEQDHSKSPSIASEKPDLKDVLEPTDKSRSASIASVADQKEEDHSKSPSISSEKPDVKDVLEPTDKSRSASIASVADQKEPDHSKSPSVASEKPDVKDVLESTDKSRSASIASTADQKEPDHPKSPSIASEKPDLKDVLEPTDKSRSASIASVADHKEQDHSKSPSIASEKPDLKDVLEPTDKSRSASIASVADQKEQDHSKSPSISSEKPDVKDVLEPTDKSRSASIASVADQKEPDHSKSPSISSEKPDVKDVLEPTDKSRSASIASTADQKEPDHSKSPSIASEKPDLKDVLEPTDKSRSASIASVADQKEEDHSKSPSVVSEKPDVNDVLEPTDKSRSASIASTADQKEPDHSKSPSIASEKPDLKDVLETIEKSRSASIASAVDQKEPDHSKSPSIASEKPDLKDVLETIDKSRSASIASVVDQKEPDHSKSPSIASEKPDLTDVLEPTDKSRSVSIASAVDQKEPDHSKSPSIASEKPDLKDVLEPTDKSRSVSIASVADQKESTDLSKSPSVTGEKSDLKDVLEPVEKSRSGSIVSTGDQKEAAGHSKSPSIAGDKPDLKDVLEPVDKSRSASIVADQKDPDLSKSPSAISVASSDKQKSPSAGSEKDELLPTDRAKSPSVKSDKSDEKEPTGGSRTPSIAGDKVDHKDFPEESAEKSKSPSLSDDKISVKETYEDAIDKSRSPSVASEKLLDKEPTPERKFSDQSVDKSGERSKSPSVIGDKIEEAEDEKGIEKSRVSSVASEKQLATELTTAMKSPVDKPLSSSVDKVGQKTTSPTDDVSKEKESEKSKSESIDSEKPDETKDVHSKSPTKDKRSAEEPVDDKHSRDGSPTEEKTPLDRSRSHSVVEAGEKTPLGRSRAASLYEDKAPEKLSLVEEVKATLKLSDPTARLEEKEESQTSPKKGDSRKSSAAEIGKDKIDSRRSSHATEYSEKHESRRSSRAKDSYATHEADHLEETDEDFASVEKKAEIEKYIIDEYVTKKKKITIIIVEQLVMTYSVPKFVVMDVIEDIIQKKQISRESIMDFVDGTPSDTEEPKVEDIKADILPADKKADIEKYIIEEFINKNKKISSKTLDEVTTLKAVPRYILITIIEEIIITKKIAKMSVIESDVIEEIDRDKETLVKKDEKVSTSASPESEKVALTSVTPQETTDTHDEPQDAKKPADDDKLSPLRHDKPSEDKISALTQEQLETDSQADSKSLRSSRESIASDKSTQDSPARSEPHIDEEVSISEEKRRDVEKLLEEEYVKKLKKITDVVLEEIIMRTGLPLYIILEIVEEIILKKKLVREDVISVDLYPEDETDDLVMMERYESKYSEDSVHHAQLGDSEKSSGKMSEYPGADDRHLGKSVSGYSMDYESPFHKAFVGGMTEMRTTHITTLSGKSTPDFTPRDGTPDSASEPTTSTIERAQVPSDKVSPVSSIKGDRTVITQVLRDTKISEPAPEEPDTVSKDVKTEVGETQEPEVITKIVKREIIEQEEPEIITKVIKREVIEQEEPDVISKVIKHEIVVPEDSTDIAKDIIKRIVSGEESTTTEVTKVVTDESSDSKASSSGSGKPEIYSYTIPSGPTTDQADTIKKEFRTTSESSPVHVTKIISRESTPEVSVSADVKRIVTTVTTITEPDGTVTTKKDVKESTDTMDSAELEKLIDSVQSDKTGKVTTETKDGSKAEKIVKETIMKVTSTSGTSTPDVKTFYDSGKSTPDWKQEEKSETTGKDMSDKGVEHAVFPLVRDLISDDKSYSGKSSPDISLPKDIVYSGSTGKSTPEVPVSPLIRDSAAPHFSERSTPDRRSDRSATATPEGFRSGEVIRTIITTTRTMSEEGEIITMTKEVTETTNEKGETVILAEKTDTKVDDWPPGKDTAETAISSVIGGMKPTETRGESAAGSDVASEMDIAVSSPPSSPLSTDSHKDETHRPVEFATAAMTSSFYGEMLPEMSPMMRSDPVFPSSSPSSIEKEYASGHDDKRSTKKYVDEADMDFEKALMDRGQMRDVSGTFSSDVVPRYTNGSLTTRDGLSDSSREDRPTSSSADARRRGSKKDPLEDWGSPLGLPSPKPPRKFNLKNPIKSSSSADLTPDSLTFDVVSDWGEPLRLPSPAPVANEVSNKGAPATPKKDKKQAKKVQSENIKNKKRSESPGKNEKKAKDSKNKVQPVYMDLTYVPHHGNSYYTSLEFFKRVRARYYVFSGTEPSREVYDALLDAKKTWEDKDLEVTMIPTYDTDTLGYWVADNEEVLAANRIDLSPSASRCTINLQDHETSCSAYRLEF